MLRKVTETVEYNNGSVARAQTEAMDSKQQSQVPLALIELIKHRTLQFTYPATYMYGLNV